MPSMNEGAGGDAEAWQRVYDSVMERGGDMGISLTTLYRLTKVSEATYKKMRAGIPLKRSEKRRNLTDGLGWTPNSIDLILAGEAPQLAMPEDNERGDIDRLAEQVEAMRAELDEVKDAVKRLTQILREGRSGRPDGT